MRGLIGYPDICNRMSQYPLLFRSGLSTLGFLNPCFSIMWLRNLTSSASRSPQTEQFTMSEKNGASNMYCANTLLRKSGRCTGLPVPSDKNLSKNHPATSLDAGPPPRRAAREAFGRFGAVLGQHAGCVRFSIRYGSGERRRRVVDLDRRKIHQH